MRGHRQPCCGAATPAAVAGTSEARCSVSHPQILSRIVISQSFARRGHMGGR